METFFVLIFYQQCFLPQKEEKINNCLPIPRYIDNTKIRDFLCDDDRRHCTKVIGKTIGFIMHICLNFFNVTLLTFEYINFSCTVCVRQRADNYRWTTDLSFCHSSTTHSRQDELLESRWIEVISFYRNMLSMYISISFRHYS